MNAALQPLPIALENCTVTICMVAPDARYSLYASRTIHLSDSRVVEQSVAAV
jgi:hypothetical protein